MSLKLGYVKKADQAKLKLQNYTGPALPPPPRETTNRFAITTALGMFLNDQHGVCTAADVAHGIMTVTANGDGIVVPSDADILPFYKGYVPGFDPHDESTDLGGSLSDASKQAMKVGMAGQKLDAYVDVDWTDVPKVKQAVYLFGQTAFGCRLPKSAIDNVGARDWNNITDKHYLGGHDMLIIDYDDEGVWFVTWGTLQHASWQWVATYGDECQARIYYARVAKSVGVDPNGFRLDQLEADKQALV